MIVNLPVWLAVGFAWCTFLYTFSLLCLPSLHFVDTYKQEVLDKTQYSDALLQGAARRQKGGLPYLQIRLTANTWFADSSSSVLAHSPRSRAIRIVVSLILYTQVLGQFDTSVLRSSIKSVVSEKPSSRIHVILPQDYHSWIPPEVILFFRTILNHQVIHSCSFSSVVAVLKFTIFESNERLITRLRYR